MTAVTSAALFLLLFSIVRSYSVPYILSWTKEKVNYPIPVSEAGGGILGSAEGGWYHTIIGGFGRFPNATRRVYARKVAPVKSDAWIRLADMPEPLTHMAQAMNERYFYGVGGYYGDHPGVSVNSSFEFDFVANKWSRLPDLPEPRAGGGLVVIAGRWLVFSGGLVRPFRDICCVTDKATTWSLDLWQKEKGWRNDSAPIPSPRNHMAGVKSCGRYFWVGGQYKSNEHTGNSDVVSEYIPWDRKWVKDKEIAYLPDPFGHISASVLPYNCGILVVGGTGQNRTLRNQVLWWDPHGNFWRSIGFFPKKVATAVCGLLNDLLVCGGGESWHPDETFSTRLKVWETD